MEAMRFFAFMGIFLAGGVLMAVLLELLSTEGRDLMTERRVELEPGVRSAAALPAFFAKPQSDAPMGAASIDEALIAFIQEHVRAEQAMVTKFVHFPSVDSLYRQATPPTMH